MGNSMVPSEGIPPTVQNIPQKALADAINRFAIIYGGIESLQTDWVLKKALTELSAMFPNLTHADREFVHNYIHNQCRIEDETSK